MALLQLLPDTTSPAVHAMVVGVGNYYHLIGGNSPNPTSNWALRQLSSAPASALHFLNWLLHSFHHPTKPLATIEHLVSAPAVVKDRNGVAQQSEEPTMKALQQACKRWSDRASGHPHNIALLYFCGHGISKGGETGLLAADFDDPTIGAMTDNAAHVEKTVQGMMSCRANNQCFFIDACRVQDPNLQETITDPGRALINSKASDIRNLAQPIYFSTGLTEPAQAAAGEPSLFTKALIEALDGMAADDDDGTYEAGKCIVNTERLGPAIRKAMELGKRRSPWLSGQDCIPSGGGSFALHYPQNKIELPFIVGCQPVTFHRLADLTVSMNATVIDRRSAGVSDESWETRLSPGTYDVDLSLATPPTSRTKRVMLTPPGKEPTFDLP